MDLEVLKEIVKDKSEEEIILKIKIALTDLYNNEFKKFHQSMYRLDINEYVIEKFETSKDFMFLANSVWNRQKHKMKNWNN